MKRWLVFGLAALCLLVPRAASAAPELQLVKRLWGTGEIRIITSDGKDRLIERFKEPQAVHGSEVSPDGRFAFLWHNGSRGPRRLTIYDLRTGKRTAHFKPGFGGELGFTPSGNLIHTWGCGSNCHAHALYSPKGRVLLKGDVSGADVSPTRRFLVTSPSLLDAEVDLSVVDLDSGKTLFKMGKRARGRFVLNDIEWDDANRTIEIKLDDRGGDTRRLVLKPGRAGKLVASFPDGLPG